MDTNGSIKVQELYRHMYDNIYPSGEIMTEGELVKLLAKTPGSDKGSRIINLRTRETVYEWNKDKWQWDCIEHNPPLAV